MEQRNEPTTAEIVKALRDEDNPNVLDWLDDAADRLELLECENTEKIQECAACGIQFSTKIKTLEAELAAEKARADAAERCIEEARPCIACKYVNLDIMLEPCRHCWNGEIRTNWEWRGAQERGKS